jgi:hypothetical protein
MMAVPQKPELTSTEEGHNFMEVTEPSVNVNGTGAVDSLSSSINLIKIKNVSYAK